MHPFPPQARLRSDEGKLMRAKGLRGLVLHRRRVIALVGHFLGIGTCLQDYLFILCRPLVLIGTFMHLAHNMFVYLQGGPLADI